MRWGLEFWNLPTAGSDEERERVAALGGACAKLRGYHPPEVVDWLLSLWPDCLFLLRRSHDGLIDAAQQVSEAAPLLQHLHERGAKVVYLLDNEPNHQQSPNRAYSVNVYGARLGHLVGEFRRAYPWLPLCSPPMAVMQDDLAWLRELVPLYWTLGLEYAGCHLYWQYDNHGSPDWGRRIEQYGALLPGVHWLVDELGDSTPDRGPAEKAGRVLDVLHWLRGRGDVEAATLFIAGGTWDWRPFWLPVEDLRRIRQGMEGEVTEAAQPGYTRIGNGYLVEDLRGRLPARGEYDRRSLSGITTIVIHHSAVPVDSAAEAIARYHSESLQWPGIGYHFVVHQDGHSEWCQDLDRMSYHVSGRNREMVGICLPGDWSGQIPPAAQLAACRRLVAEIQFQLGWFVPVRGHREVARPGQWTACPGATWYKWRDQVTVEPP